MKTKLCLLVAGSLPVAAMSLPSSAAAQQVAMAPTATCMARTSNAPSQRPLLVVVPADRQSEMAARGFSVRACKSDSTWFATYRAKVCERASKVPEGLSRLLLLTDRSSPAEMCSMANAAAQQTGG